MTFDLLPLISLAHAAVAVAVVFGIISGVVVAKEVFGGNVGVKLYEPALAGRAFFVLFSRLSRHITTGDKLLGRRLTAGSRNFARVQWAAIMVQKVRKCRYTNQSIT